MRQSSLWRLKEEAGLEFGAVQHPAARASPGEPAPPNDQVDIILRSGHPSSVARAAKT
jgi:hypothetical protein